ncbi:Thiol-disulfide isomerase or thioredoxin [Flagellimonas flava]|uniref:Thiol-disulfide isomerase or thioredoxin n=2 Tax=Flagellimonas flava TaxID=570519 RepID=A0A1M5PGC5_9FLAO|nr:Thiol-disulfide isomerase or thioredoxin [Allomuricauda flava]
MVVWVSTLFMLASCGKKAKAQETTDTAKVETEALQTEASSAKVKFPVYDFESFESMLHLQDGKTYVINFWATWCKPCIEEMPYFEQVNAERATDGVEVILVSLDMPSMWKSRLEPFVEKKGLKSKVVILDDPKQNDWIPKINEDWDGGIPATLIYNKNKREFYGHGFTYDELNTELNKFIN